MSDKERLLSAANSGDIKTVTALLNKGVFVDTATKANYADVSLFAASSIIVATHIV